MSSEQAVLLNKDNRKALSFNYQIIILQEKVDVNNVFQFFIYNDREM